MSVKLGLPH